MLNLKPTIYSSNVRLIVVISVYLEKSKIRFKIDPDSYHTVGNVEKEFW